MRGAERVSGILLKRESLPSANEVGGHDRGKRYVLSTYYSSTLWYLELCTATVSSCVIRAQSKLRKVRGFALTSDLQQQRSSIMMHPAGNSAARRQRCSDALIPSRQPRSVFTSTWSLSRACYVRVCCVLSICVMRVENLMIISHTYGKSFFIGKMCGTVWD